MLLSKYMLKSNIVAITIFYIVMIIIVANSAVITIYSKRLQ